VVRREAGDHRAWWEPFCGGVSVLFSKPRCRQEVLNDLHGDIVNLTMVTASDRWIQLADRAQRTLYSEALYAACLKRFEAEPTYRPPADPDAVADADVARAYRYLLLTWMGRNGTSGMKRVKFQWTLRYTCNGGDSAVRWRQVCESIPAWHDRLIGVAISNRDGFVLLEKIDDAPGTVIYLDPPYVEEGDAYLHPFESDDAPLLGKVNDHRRLADVARRFKRARVIISYYDHPSIDSLYPGWTKRALAVAKNLAVQNKRGAGRVPAPEVLLINGPSLAKGAA
jgi:DNA adenine methylase